ncbi:Protein kinase alk2 [Orbilia ellipsospora]|uniref:Protein kinase alk2 n=1 Tax=Orbilia ellipsospora TaxID=2528407 RepID=A0AAV9X9J4_9PEZI
MYSGNYEEYGNTFAYNVLGETTYSTCEPRNIQHFLANQFKDFAIAPAKNGPFFPLLGDGIFVIDGHGWEYSRALLRPQFARNQITQLENMEEHFQVFKDCIPDGTAAAAELQELFFELTVDSATHFLFGESCDTLGHRRDILQGKVKQEIPSGAAFAKAFNETQSHMFTRFFLKGLHSWHNPKQFQEAVKICKDFTERYVSDVVELAKSGKLNETTKSGKYVFLQAIAKDTQDPIILRDATMNLLLAGRDTTGSLLGWLFYLLVRYPDVQAKLRRAIVADFGAEYDPSRITFESLKNCKYLRWVLDETLRLYPTVPINMRTAIRDTTLPLGGGPDGKSPVFIPKGSHIEYSVYAMHRRADIYGDDANWFRPERWESRPKTDAFGWEYLPFNGGPRICLGQQFALTEAGYTVVRMFQEYKRFESEEMDPFIKCFSTLTTCVGGKGVLVRCYKE